MDNQEQVKEIKEVFSDAKMVQEILAKYNITSKQYLNSIPVLLNTFFPDAKEVTETAKLIVRETAILHKMMYKTQTVIRKK